MAKGKFEGKEPHVNDEQKQRIEQIALFRFGVLGDLVHVTPGERAIYDQLKEKADREYQIPFSTRTPVAAETIRLAAGVGLVGGSIEDATGDRGKPLYDIAHATERVTAAVEAARALPFPFTLTARAENFLRGNPDLDDTIRRLQAFEKAGADVLYAPGLRTLEQMRTVVQSVTKPLNVVMGFADPSITLDELREIGVRRVSIGGGLSRLALAAFLEGAREMRAGRFGFVTRMAAMKDLWPAFA